MMTIPMPGAADDVYFPYLRRSLAEWLSAHPDETAHGLETMALLAIGLREATRAVFGKARTSDVVYAWFLEWAKEHEV